MERQHTCLKKWIFAAGDGIGCLEHGREICVPHSWDAEDGEGERFGSGWYAYALFAPDEWRDKRVIAHFHAVRPDAAVFLNGKEIGGRRGAGRASFDVELTGALKIGAVNQLVVRVDAAPGGTEPPSARDPDRTDESVTLREVELWVVGAHYVKELRITAEPVDAPAGERAGKGGARWRVEALLDGGAESRLTLGWKLLRERDGQGPAGAGPLVPGLHQYAGAVLCHDGRAVVETLLPEADYWYPDRPALYTVTLRLRSGAVVEDEVSCTFGFRGPGVHFLIDMESDPNYDK